jgi:FkbM family methyltransferase
VDLGYRGKYLYSFRASNDLLINPSDTVIETGVYHGKDTAGYAKLGKRVIGFEPSPRNYAIAKENLKDFNNVELLNEGLWNEQSELTIRYGEDGSEDGFLQPDAGEEEVEYNIPVNTLENYVKRLDIDEVNFLKIEAEGAEPEVIEGMGNIRPDRIAVDVSAERDGEPTTKPVMELLHSMGYELHGVNNGYVLIFSRKESDKYTFNNIFD